MAKVLIHSLRSRGTSDYSKAKQHLGWEPKTRMKALAELMVDADWAGLS